jgi:predicted nucleotidyltransferase
VTGNTKFLGTIESMKTALQLTPVEIEKYRRAALKVGAAPDKTLRARRIRAWRVARKAAKILKAEFDAKKVAVFGSLLHPSLFHTKSDIDLAVWGMDDKKYYRAVSILLDIDPTISLDLVCVEDARPALRNVIEKEGREL